jgi:hypothetical protein
LGRIFNSEIVYRPKPPKERPPKFSKCKKCGGTFVSRKERAKHSCPALRGKMELKLTREETLAVTTALAHAVSSVANIREILYPHADRLPADAANKISLQLQIIQDTAKAALRTMGMDVLSVQ